MPTATKPIHTITLEYHLSELPTAQHKAGLAGLVLQIRNLHDREEDFEAEDLPVLDEVTRTSCRLEVTERSLQVLIDELYSARKERVQVKSKWAGADLIETVKVTVEVEEEEDKGDKNDSAKGKKKEKKVKEETRYVYEVTTPRNPFMMQYLDSDIWQKLWRDMIYQIPRNKPASRRPYDQRAKGESCSEGAKVWKELDRFEKEKKKNRIRTTSVASSLLLGAQDVTAEREPFADRSDHNLLLHFWPLTAMIYVPWLLDINPSQPSRSRGEAVGFSLAIPEVCDLEEFCEVFPSYLEQLNEHAEPKGYRPRSACIDLASQSALQFLSSLEELTAAKIEGHRDISDLIQSVEYRHLAKFGNNVKSLGTGHIVTNRDLLREYNKIREYWNPVFRAIRIEGLLQAHRDQERLDLWSSPWWRAFQSVLEIYPYACFLQCSDTPREMRSFPRDLRIVYANLQTEFQTRKENSMNETPPDRPLALLIRSLVRNYVMQKAENRSNMKWDDIKENKTKDKETGEERINVPKDFSDAQAKVASQTFLEVRSRHGQDFSQYFVDVFGSVSQRSLLKQEDYLTVSQAVLNSPDDVRILVMLALSANS